MMVWTVRKEVPGIPKIGIRKIFKRLDLKNCLWKIVSFRLIVTISFSAQNVWST